MLTDMGQSAARVEATQLFHLMEKKHESLASMRMLIEPGSRTDSIMWAFRKSVLHIFNKLVAGEIAPVRGGQGKAGKSSRIRRSYKQKKRVPSMHTLTPREIEKARRLLATGDISVAHVAQRFGVSITLLRRLGLSLNKTRRIYMSGDYAPREKRSIQWGAHGS
jgi:hypothetical protein